MFSTVKKFIKSYNNFIFKHVLLTTVTYLENKRFFKYFYYCNLR